MHLPASSAEWHPVSISSSFEPAYASPSASVVAALSHPSRARKVRIVLNVAAVILIFSLIFSTSSLPAASAVLPPSSASPDDAFEHLTGKEMADSDADTDSPTASAPPPATPAAPILGAQSERESAYSKAIEQSCAAWPRPVMDRFKTRCGYWVAAFADWEARTKASSGPMSYTCASEGLCHGLGDRMGGMQSAISAAVHEHRPLRFEWPGLREVMTSCALTSDIGSWWRSAQHPHPSCDIRTGQLSSPTCHHALLNDCKLSQTTKLMQMDRACLYPYMCEGLRARLPSSLNAADIFGCPMRIALEPKTSFLDTSINFWAEGAMSPMSVAQAAQLMAKYFVISIHFRLGDDWAFHHTAQSERQDLTLPFKCAQTVQSFAEKRPLAPTSSHAAWKEDMDLWQPGDDERLVDGRPVRWFLASDSKALRKRALRQYGKRLLMLDMEPKHIAFIGHNAVLSNSSVVVDTFAEWYLLGLGDRLVLNRYGRDGLFEGSRPDVNRLYVGRVSSFPKTSWTYQLKHLFYDAISCKEMDIPVDGTWKDVKKFPQCRSAPAFRQELDQPHLAGISFPSEWVMRGAVVTQVEDANASGLV